MSDILEDTLGFYIEDNLLGYSSCLTLFLTTLSSLRCGSKSRSRGSMFTGDCRRPFEQRYQSVFTRPQKSGPRTKQVKLL